MSNLSADELNIPTFISVTFRKPITKEYSFSTLNIDTIRILTEAAHVLLIQLSFDATA